MEISVINGSPKFKENNVSGLLINTLISELQMNEEKIEIYRLNKRNITAEQIEKIGESDIIIFAFPLYIDSFPALVLRFLMEMEEKLSLTKNKNLNKFSKTPIVYCILNNGFFEGSQNHIVIQQMKIWCKKIGFTWGQGIGVGSGEALPALSKIPFGKGPKKNLGKAILKLASNIKNMKSGEDIYVSLNYPRFLWLIQAKMYWIMEGKKYGLKKKDLYRVK